MRSAEGLPLLLKAMVQVLPVAAFGVEQASEFVSSGQRLLKTINVHCDPILKRKSRPPRRRAGREGLVRKLTAISRKQECHCPQTEQRKCCRLRYWLGRQAQYLCGTRVDH